MIIKKFLFIPAFSISALAMAQTIPTLPGPVYPGPKDTSFFVCDVANVNEDIMGMSGRGNFWTRAATGGKFKAVSPIVVKVASQSESSAVQDLYNFYKEFAAAAFIRSPWYDRGNRLNAQSLVKKCELDKSRATGVSFKKVPLDAYKNLTTGRDHSLNFIALTKLSLTDEQVAKLVREKPLSNDVFERREQIENSANSGRSAAQSAAGPYVILEGQLFLEKYNIETNSFDLSNLQHSAQQYAYLSKPGSFESVPPAYELTIPAKMSTYRPGSIEEAKRVEKARSKRSYMKLKTFVQITDATLVSSSTFLFKGVVAAIEVRDDTGNLLFVLRAE